MFLLTTLTITQAIPTLSITYVVNWGLMLLRIFQYYLSFLKWKVTKSLFTANELGLFPVPLTVCPMLLAPKRCILYIHYVPKTSTTLQVDPVQFSHCPVNKR